MPIRYPQILEHNTPVQTWSWTERDFIHYALCLGLGHEPTDPRALRFVYEGHEEGLGIVPTFPTVIAWVADPTFAALGVDPMTALHGEQKIELHRRIPCPVTVKVQGRVVAVHDKGAGRGAVVITEHVIIDVADGKPIATLTTSCFGRSEGGCGGSVIEAPQPHCVPARAPYRSIDFLSLIHI